MITNNRLIMVVGMLLLSTMMATPSHFTGELSGLTNRISSGSDSHMVTLGIRYIPIFSMEFPSINESLIDFEFAGNLSGSYQVDSANKTMDTTNFNPYRIWLRYSTQRFESRFGLQKIAFGPAKLFRPLMWFDRLDPRDPLQLTDGVYGLRLRYDFQNNANIWLWGLYGNKDTKGWERIPTKNGTPEFGGRWQYPLGNGEMALTIHRRRIDQASGVDSAGIDFTGKSIVENRIALDGIWDIGTGIWFEAALIDAPHGSSYPNLLSFLTLGMDYTFGIGNGLTIMGEHFLLTAGDTPYNTENKTEISGIILSYPQGLLDQFLLFYIYNWDFEQSYQYISWQRTYDLWTFHISGFLSSHKKSVGVNESLSSIGLRGIQLIIIFNH